MSNFGVKRNAEEQSNELFDLILWLNDKVSDLLSKLSDGYNTAIGERGVKLSGGEKQRIALARALLKRPKILIMDEATSALDSHTEREILESLNAEFSNISKIIITHNVNNLNFVDKIINLNRL